MIVLEMWSYTNISLRVKKNFASWNKLIITVIVLSKPLKYLLVKLLIIKCLFIRLESVFVKRVCFCTFSCTSSTLELSLMMVLKWCLQLFRISAGRGLTYHAVATLVNALQTLQPPGARALTFKELCSRYTILRGLFANIIMRVHTQRKNHIQTQICTN